VSNLFISIPSVIVQGAFGVVSLVREREIGQLFAVKQVRLRYRRNTIVANIVIPGVQPRKVDMPRKGQEGHVRAERDVLETTALDNSPGGANGL